MGGLQAITCCTPVKGVYYSDNGLQKQSSKKIELANDVFEKQNDVSFGRKINPKVVKELFEQGSVGKKAAKNIIKANQRSQKLWEKQGNRHCGLSHWQQYALEQSEQMLRTYDALLSNFHIRPKK